MRKHGHENKIERLRWREYVLWDMQRKHDQEMEDELRKNLSDN